LSTIRRKHYYPQETRPGTRFSGVNSSFFFRIIGVVRTPLYNTLSTHTEMSATTATSPLSAVPDERGRFGQFGRRYVPETLMYALDELTQAYADARRDPEFNRQLQDLL